MSLEISNDRPAQRDLQLNVTLAAFLQKNNLLDEPTRTARRQPAVKYVEGICRNWTASRTGIAQGRIVLHGSVAFGAQLRTSDIDAIFICPNTVTSEQFFSELPRLLSASETISNVRPLTRASWPIIKLCVGGDIDFDIQPAICKLGTVPDDVVNRDILELRESS